MRPGLVFQLFWRSSRVQRKRGLLTVAAIAWGSLSLVLLLSFGEGLKRQLTIAGAGLGTNIAIMWPGETTRPWNGLPAGRPEIPFLLFGCPAKASGLEGFGVLFGLASDPYPGAANFDLQAVEVENRV